MTFLQLLLLSVAITLGLAAELDDSSGGGLQGEYARLNPYVRGCLNAKLPQTNPLQKKWRVCNSEDPAELRGIVCREPPFQEYMELRIASGNWDSAVALSWLTQIVLSELLGVPTTSEAGKWGDTRSFYDLNGRIDLNVNARSSFVQAPSNETLLHPMNRGDCAALTDTRMVTADEYIPCAHFIPEFWGTASPEVLDSVNDGLLEPPSGLGVLGRESWFVTKFTAEEDPSIVSYLGLKGEENRHKLAALFKRPVTWQQYCEEVSSSNCTEPDATAERYPNATESEDDKMYADGLYRGYFRFTDANNCTKWPTNCTGHVANYPCGWTSGMESNIYHFEMGLDPNNGPGGSPSGYTTNQLTEMWHAANATGENLIMMWWTPEPLYQKFFNTNAEMQYIMMNPYNLECAKAREESLDESCEANLVDRVGPPEASCANPSEPLSKLVTGKMHDFLNAPDIPEAATNPAYDMMRRFQFSEQQLGQLFDLWESSPTPRDAVCQWAADNLDYLLGMVPSSYPRSIVEEPISAFGYAMIGLGTCATIVVLATAFMVVRKRDKPAVKYAQLDFLYMLLCGSALVGIGAILSSVPATNGSCISTEWFINIGYTLELLPVVVKAAAINKMMTAARSMRRISLNRNTLYRIVAGIVLLMAVFLAIWTGLDPPQRTAEYQMTDTITESQDLIVGVSYFCSGGESDAWHFAAVGARVLLLICASVLAFQTRNAISTFNESRTLAFLIYSHFVFVLLRAGLVVFQNNFSGIMSDYLRTLLLSLDQIAACVIYFLPKLISQDDGNRHSSHGQHPSTGFSDASGGFGKGQVRISGLEGGQHSIRSSDFAVGSGPLIASSTGVKLSSGVSGSAVSIPEEDTNVHNAMPEQPYAETAQISTELPDEGVYDPEQPLSPDSHTPSS